MNSKFIKTNTYYVLRDKCLLEINLDEINDGEVFLFNGRTSSDIYDLIIVFAHKKMNKINIIEVHHNLDATAFRLINVSQKKLSELVEIHQ